MGNQCVWLLVGQSFQTWSSYRVQHGHEKQLKLCHFCGLSREPFRKPINNPKTQDESGFSRRTGFLSQVRFRLVSGLLFFFRFRPTKASSGTVDFARFFALHCITICLKHVFGDVWKPPQHKTAINTDKSYPELRGPLGQRSSQLNSGLLSTHKTAGFIRGFS